LEQINISTESKLTCSKNVSMVIMAMNNECDSWEDACVYGCVSLNKLL